MDGGGGLTSVNRPATVRSAAHGKGIRHRQQKAKQQRSPSHAALDLVAELLDQLDD